MGGRRVARPAAGPPRIGRHDGDGGEIALRRGLRTVAAASGAAAAVASPAALALSRETNLDGDAGRERVRTYVRSDPQIGRRAFVEISDRCPGGALRRVVSRRDERLQFLKLVNADTRRGKDVFFTIRSGATGRGGHSRLVAWRRTGDPQVCRTPQYVFQYTIENPTRDPTGTRGVAGFDVTLKERESRFPGQEVLLSERFIRSGEAFCCASVIKRSFWRYDETGDRYTRYRTSVRRGRGG